MSLLRLIRKLRTTQPIIDDAVRTLRRRLAGKTNATVLAQAEARLRRQIYFGANVARATDAAVDWATTNDHGVWAR